MTTTLLFPLIAFWGDPSAAALSTEFDPFHVNLGRVLAILLLVLLNGFFVAAEFAIVKVRPTQLEDRLDQGDRRAALVKNIMGELESYLSATQLGITLASIALGVVAEPFFAAMLSPVFAQFGYTNPAGIHGVSFVLSFSIVTYLHVVLGELMPKTLALHRALPTALFVARPLQVFRAVFAPLIWLFHASANLFMRRVFRVEANLEHEAQNGEDELKLLVHESERSAAVTEIEKEILINAMDLNDLVARDIMMPRNEVITLDRSDRIDEAFQKAIESQHTRFPLVDGHLDHTLGLIHVKDLIRASRESVETLQTLMRPIDPVPEMMPVDRLLKMFLSRNTHMALVVDEYGGSLGIVTLDNVLEELVGIIKDEFDNDEEEEELFRRISDDEFEVDGSFPLYELAAVSDLELEDPEVSTVGGFVTHLLGHLPEQDERVEVEGYVATVTETDGKKVNKLRFRRLVEEEVSGEESDGARLTA